MLAQGSGCIDSCEQTVLSVPVGRGGTCDAAQPRYVATGIGRGIESVQALLSIVSIAWFIAETYQVDFVSCREKLG